MYPAADGVIISSVITCADNDSWKCGSGFGNHVIIRHDRLDQSNPLCTLYGHLKASSVRTGGAVSFDDVIGVVAMLGATHGAHLHRAIGTCPKVWGDRAGGCSIWSAPDTAAVSVIRGSGCARQLSRAANSFERLERRVRETGHPPRPWPHPILGSRCRLSEPTWLPAVRPTQQRHEHVVTRRTQPGPARRGFTPTTVSAAYTSRGSWESGTGRLAPQLPRPPARAPLSRSRSRSPPGPGASGNTSSYWPKESPSLVHNSGSISAGRACQVPSSFMEPPRRRHDSTVGPLPQETGGRSAGYGSRFATSGCTPGRLPALPQSSFIGAYPTRLLDTRPGAATFDNRGQEPAGRTGFSDKGGGGWKTWGTGGSGDRGAEHHSHRNDRRRAYHGVPVRITVPHRQERDITTGQTVAT